MKKSRTLLFFIGIFLIILIIIIVVSLHQRRVGYSVYRGEGEIGPLPTSSYVGIKEEYEKKEISAARKIILTAELELIVKNFEQQHDKIVKITQEAGGFVAESSTHIDEDKTKSGYIIIRVPKAKFYNIISQLEKLGEVKHKYIKGEDVTEEYIDLETRIRNLQRQENQLLKVLAKATTVKDILEVEKELGRIRGKIEQHTGRIKYLKDRIELATITIQLTEKRAITPPTIWNIGDTIHNATRAFLQTVRGAISLIIWVVIFSPFIILLVLLVYIYSKYMKKKVKNNSV